MAVNQEMDRCQIGDSVPLRLTSLLVLIFALSLGSFAQSGRVKPTETPTPVPSPRPAGVYLPANERERRVAEKPPATPVPIYDDDEVIKVESTLIPIPVSVVNLSGRSIKDLRLKDFLLKIDGVEVEISEVLRAEIPVRLALLFDNSGSVLTARDFEIRAAVRFLRSIVRPDRDMVSLFSIGTVSRLEHRYTNDVESIVRTIQSFPPPDGATALLDAVELAGRYLSEVEGRRVIVIVSDGEDTKTDTTFENAVRMVQQFNCQVFVVKTTEFENFIRTGSRKTNANLQQLVAERRMAELARQTGGKVYSPIDEGELGDAFREIAAELSEQYILSYYPENESEMRGQFREISVEIRGRTDLTVRTRKGYYVPRR